MTKLNDVIFNETRNILDAYESAKMAEWQENRSIPEEDLPFQLAVRFMFVMWCAKELAVLGSRSEELKVLYSTIQEQGGQTFVENFASAARSGTLNTADIVNGIMEFLVISGISFQQPSFQKVEGAVQSSVETVLREVVKLKADFELRVTSSDLEAHYVRSPSCFDAKTMIDTDAGGRGARKGRKEEAVLCTVGLGLRKVVLSRIAHGAGGSLEFHTGRNNGGKDAEFRLYFSRSIEGQGKAIWL